MRVCVGAGEGVFVTLPLERWWRLRPAPPRTIAGRRDAVVGPFRHDAGGAVHPADGRRPDIADFCWGAAALTRLAARAAEADQIVGRSRIRAERPARGGIARTLPVAVEAVAVEAVATEAL